MKIILFANTDWYLYNFRLSLSKALRSKGHEVILVSPPGRYGKLLEREGFTWIAIKMNRRSLNPWGEIQTILRLVSLYKRQAPDIVHHFTIKCVIYGSIAATFARVPSKINAVTGLGYIFTSDCLYAKILRIIVKIILRFVLSGKKTILILQNPDDVKIFLKNKLIAPKKVKLIRGSGVDINRYRPKFRCKKENFQVLLATRLLWDKGIREYVEAAKILKAEDKKVDFLMAGSIDRGNPDSISQEKINKWEENGFIIPLGHVDKMEELLAKVDIVTLPTTYGEGVPKILLEAAACGLPIVATDVPGCREIVSNGENGFLVPPKNPEALANAIRLLIDDENRCMTMGREGRKKILAEFDERIIIKQTLDVYKEIMPEF